MVAEWRFEPKRRSQKSRDPMQASFFTNASIDDDTHALVREAIQNSLDAKSDSNPETPVRVRFSIGSHSAESGVMSRYLSDDAWLHFNAEDCGLTSPPAPYDECRFLVYEDFNTDGLIGDEHVFEAQPKNSFYYFMRAEGQSGKEVGERGRHGIGKYVFPYTSGIRAFIAITVRSSDRRCLIAGQCVLKSHHVGEKRFTPDGWWGSFEQDGEDDYFQMPVEDQALFQQLKKDFGLVREIEQSGLSLVMPYIQAEVSSEKLVEHVIHEYFWPILNDQLVVEIVEEGRTRTVDRDTIHNNLGDWLPQQQLEKVFPYITLAAKSLGGGEYPVFMLSLPDKPSMPKWDKDYLNGEKATAIHQELSKMDAIIRVRCPLYVQQSDSSQSSISHFDIYLAKDVDDVARKPLFIREGIKIPEDRVPPVRGYASIVVIEPGELATLLGDSENPAHTEWEKNAAKFRNKYRWGPTTIDFVRLSVGKFFSLMSQEDNEEDATILSDIFYLDLPENEEEVPESRKRKESVKPGRENVPPIEPIEPSSPRTYRLTKSQNGFVVKGPINPLDGNRKYKITVAYDFSGASKARAMKSYHKNDFDLSAGKSVSKPITENINDILISGNAMEFIASSNDFRIEVNGFDSNRDIIVDVNSEVVKSEEI